MDVNTYGTLRYIQSEIKKMTSNNYDPARLANLKEIEERLLRR